MPVSDLVIPVRKCTPRNGVFRFPHSPVLASASSADVPPLTQLAEDMKGGLHLTARIERNAFGEADVRIRRDHGISNREGYRIVVSRKGVEILTRTDSGAYYAIQTLRELLGIHGKAIPACEIEDSPDFARRGVYHDCARGKVPKLSTLKALVERLSHWKINELQLYVENAFTWKQHPKIGGGWSPLRPKELLALQDHCRKHHVRLVGSLASFGHMEKILAIPQYRHLGELPGYRNQPGGTTLCPGDPGSIRLMRDLYAEFIPLFEAVDFNVCCDETWELGQGRSRRRAASVGLGKVYLDFLLKLHRLCEKHGKRMNAWADIVLKHPDVLGQVPRDIVMLNWGYRPKGKRMARTGEIVRAGLPLVVCPGTNAWNSHGCRLSMGMRNIADFASRGLRYHAEGLLNTDWGDRGHRNPLAVSMHNLCWGAAHSWNHRGTTDRKFTERFCRDTFGPLGKSLVRPIRILGSANESLRQPYSNSIILYRILVTAMRELVEDDSWRTAPIDKIGLSDLAKHTEALSQLEWVSPKKSPERFTANLLEEYALATRMELLACRRAMLVKQLRTGKPPASAQLKKLARETESFIPELKRVWSLNNKPSRLRDTLKSLRSTAKEYSRLV